MIFLTTAGNRLTQNASIDLHINNRTAVDDPSYVLKSTLMMRQILLDSLLYSSCQKISKNYNKIRQVKREPPVLIFKRLQLESDMPIA